MDESRGPLSVREIVQRAHELGINPGGAVSVQEVSAIPDDHKLLELGSSGRKNPN
jgi:hypothetical protein